MRSHFASSGALAVTTCHDRPAVRAAHQSRRRPAATSARLCGTPHPHHDSMSLRNRRTERPATWPRAAAPRLLAVRTPCANRGVQETRARQERSAVQATRTPACPAAWAAPTTAPTARELSHRTTSTKAGQSSSGRRGGGGASVCGRTTLQRYRSMTKVTGARARRPPPRTTASAPCRQPASSAQGDAGGFLRDQRRKRERRHTGQDTSSGRRR